MDKKRTTSSFRAMSTERKLESIFLFVTGRCNAKCAMCFYAQEMDKKGSPDKPGGLSIQLCKSEKKEFYIRYSS